MFDFRKFILDGFLDAIGHRPDYWVILNASGWYEKGVLLDEDMALIQQAITEKNKSVEEVLVHDDSNLKTQK